MSRYRNQLVRPTLKESQFFTGEGKHVNLREFSPSQPLGPEHVFLSSGSKPQFTTQRNVNYVLGVDEYGSESNVLSEYEKQKQIKNNIPTAAEIQKNAWILSQLLNKIRQLPHRTFGITSGVRMPEHNSAIGGAANSFHISALAADIYMVDEQGRVIPPLQLANMINKLSGTPKPEAIIAYPSNNFVHVNLRRNPDGDSTDHDTRLRVSRNGEISSLDGLPVYEEGAEYENESEITYSFEARSIRDDVGGLVEQLKVRRAANHAKLEESYESSQLGDRNPPRDGEIDIGDMRFGSVKFEEAKPEELNQPTSVSQQNAGSTLQIPMIRTDMDPISADTRVSPEIIMTLSINATTRDDVNNALRPLVAMHRRFPFCPVRNRHIVNLMLGVGVGVDNESRLKEMYPGLSDDEILELRDSLPQDLSELWVPVEMDAISVDTQPGAAGLYQVHIVMRQANILPYVPEMTFWKDTEAAVQWARYASIRSMQSTTIIEQDEENATAVTATDSVMQAEPPNLNIEGRVATRDGKAIEPALQTTSPYQSYPFKKFYRGLLEEFQPVGAGGFYDRLLEQGRTGELRPIGQTGAGADVFEPAYPIEDPTRVFEIYNPSSPIGLTYKSVAGAASREARFDNVVQDLTREIEKIEELSTALQTVDVTNENIPDLTEVGRFNYAIAMPGSRVGEILAAFEETSSAQEDAYTKFLSSVSASALDDLQQNVDFRSLGFDTNAFAIDEDSKEARFDEEAYQHPDRAGRVSEEFYHQGVRAFGDTHPMDFKVPHSTHRSVYVSFGNRFDEIQRGFIEALAEQLEKMAIRSNWGDWSLGPVGLNTTVVADTDEVPAAAMPDWSQADDPVQIISLEGSTVGDNQGQYTEPYWSGWFDVFISREIIRYVQGRNEQGDQIELPETERCMFITADGQTGGFARVNYLDSIPEGFGSYMMTNDFYVKLVEFAEGVFEDWWPEAPLNALARFKKIRKSVDALTDSILNQIKEKSGSLERALENRAEETQGYLALQNATMEHTRVRFSNKFGRKEWDGYPEPVSQHIGGGNAEITLEFTTNNRLLLDQLGELKRSQAIMAQRRKSEGVVPPLIEVENPGNLLRSLGIKRCAYHSHTQNMAENRPGYYKVRLELLQDEETLQRTEMFSRVGGTTNGQILATGAVGPLTVPLRGVPSPHESGDRARPAIISGDVSALRIFDRVYEDVNISDFEQGEMAQKQLEDYSRYIDMEEPSLEDVLSRRMISADVRYEPDWTDDGQLANDIRNTGKKYGDIVADFRWNDEDGAVRMTTDVVLSDMMPQMLSFLVEARGSMSRAAYERMVQRMEGAMSTGGGRKGLVLSWVDLATAQIADSRIAEAATRGREFRGRLVWLALTKGRMLLSALARDAALKDYIDKLKEEMQDNISDAVREVAGVKDESEMDSLSDFAHFFVRPFQLASADITNLLFSNAESYTAYQDWLSRFEATGFDTNQHKEMAVKAREGIITQQNMMPSAYTDLLMPALKDPVQDGTNILGWDFAFGPGQSELLEDKDMGRYEYADDLRQLATQRMATLGVELLDSYIGENQENITALEKPFQAAIENIRSASDKDLAGRVAFLPTDNSNALQKTVEHIVENDVFSGQLQTQINQHNLLEAHRLSETIRYVVAVLEAANLSSDTIELQNEDGTLNDMTAELGNVFDAIDQNKGFNFGTGANLASVAETVQSSSGVQEYENYLRKMRDDLVHLYEAGTEVLSDTYGYRDQFSEARRHRLMAKMRDTWKGWVGMRKAFPSYMITVSGKLGTGVMETLSDVYAWTAVGEIEVRESSEAAGQYIDLTLSNMRKRMTMEGDFDSRSNFGGQADNDAGRIDIETGSHMQVYMGYGPDTAHMKGWGGRVTAVDPGEVTRLEISSYSATLNNPPNGGKGFFIDGWDGQHTISEAILYTVSQTTGLEGLGRRAPGSALDRYGRKDRGNQMNDFRADLMSSIGRTIGGPAMEIIADKGDPHERVGTLFDAMARMGRNNLQNWVYGDSQIYENIWVHASPEREGSWNQMFFGGLADWLSGGKGWGWAALPGETAWAQLKDQSKLFEDFVVTTRPYNADIPLSQIDQHPPRQTLYFGPKTGSYIHSSREPGSSTAFVSNKEEIVNNVIDDMYGVNRFENLAELFDKTFIRSLVKAAREADNGGADRAATDRVAEGLRNYLDSVVPGFLGGGELKGVIESSLSGAFVDDVRQRMENDYPNTMTVLKGSEFWDDDGLERLLEQSQEQKEVVLPVRGIDALDPGALEGFLQGAWQWYSNIEGIVNPFANLDTTPLNNARTMIGVWDADNIPRGMDDRRGTGFENHGYMLGPVKYRTYLGDLLNGNLRSVLTLSVAETVMLIRDLAQRSDTIIDAFQKDLVNIATSSIQQQVVDPELADNPLVDEIEAALLTEGMLPDRQTQPIQKHHFASMYDTVAEQNIITTDNRPFANSVTLTFPTEPDERLGAYMGHQGEQYSYQVQAAPTISEDHIVDEQIYYPNVRYAQADFAASVQGQVDDLGNKHGLKDIQNKREALRDPDDDSQRPYDTVVFSEDEALFYDAYEENEDQNGKVELTRQEATNLVETKFMQVIQEELGPYYVRPKHSTVAVNILKDKLRHMYTGSISMAGDPSIHPYHIIHLWDDVENMHGPVEVDNVYHRFDTAHGFYTEVEPKLATYMRGADEGFDTQWLESAGHIRGMLGGLSRTFSAIGSAAGMITRIVGYGMLAGAVAKYGSKGAYIANNVAGVGEAAGFLGNFLPLINSGTMISKGFWLLAVADFARTTITVRRNWVVDRAVQHADVLQGAMDSNPVLMLPLSHRGKPFTAGLTGAIGPASRADVSASDIVDEQGNANFSNMVSALKDYYTGGGVQTE